MADNGKKIGIGESLLKSQPIKQLILKLGKEVVGTNNLKDGAVTSEKLSSEIITNIIIPLLSKLRDEILGLNPEEYELLIANDFGTNKNQAISQDFFTTVYNTLVEAVASTDEVVPVDYWQSLSPTITNSGSLEEGQVWYNPSAFYGKGGIYVCEKTDDGFIFKDGQEPIEGNLYINKTEDPWKLYIFDGSKMSPIGSDGSNNSTIETIKYWGAEEPQNGEEGDYWWNPTLLTLKGFSNGEWHHLTSDVGSDGHLMIYHDANNQQAKILVAYGGTYYPVAGSENDNADNNSITAFKTQIIRYWGETDPSTDPETASTLAAGMMWYDTSNDTLKVWGGFSGWHKAQLLYGDEGVESGKTLVFAYYPGEGTNKFGFSYKGVFYPAVVNNTSGGGSGNTSDVYTEDSDYDFEIKDESGNSILKLIGGHIITSNFDSRTIKKQIKILSIGNSYSFDAFSYVPMLFEEMGIDVTFGILYKSGSNLTYHATTIQANQLYEDFYVYTTERGVWVKGLRPATFREAMNFADWDTVIFQQVSTEASDYTNYPGKTGGPLNNILTQLAANTSKCIKVGWLQTPVPQTEVDKETYISNQNRVIADIYKETGIEYIIPCGSSIARARTKGSLNSLGDGGGLTYDGSHLQEGLPCLIEAYTTVLAIASAMKFSCNIFGSKVWPDSDWLIEKNIPGQNGTPVGMSAENCRTGQQIAISTIKEWNAKIVSIMLDN